MNLLTAVVRILPDVCVVFLALMLFGGLFRIAELAAASKKTRRHVRSLRSVDYRRFQDSEHVVPVSLIVPAATEQGGINECVGNLLSLEFKQYEVIVVANSANRDCWSSLSEEYRLLPFRQPYKKTLLSDDVAVYRSAKDVRLIVLDHPGASRASALNAGVNVSSYPIVAVAYPNQRLAKNALLVMVYAFVGDPGCVYIGSLPRVGKVGGAAEQGKPSAFERIQNIERLRTLFSRWRGYETLGMYLPHQASFGAFLKSAVMEAEGFFQESYAEQADLLIRIHARFRGEKRPYQARLLPDAVCYELPQGNARALCAAARKAQIEMELTLRQRGRAARKLPGVGFTRAAEKGWPLIELVGMLVVLASAASGVIRIWFAAFYLIASVLLSALQSAAAVLIEENAFQQTTETGSLLARYMLAIWDSFGLRQRVALAKVFARRGRRG